MNGQKADYKLHARLGIFGATPITILQDKRVTHNGLKSYIAISSYQGNNEKAFPSIQNIAERAGITPQAVYTAIKQLIDTGWIEKKRTGLNKNNVYRCLAYFEPVPEFNKITGRNKAKMKNENGVFSSFSDSIGDPGNQRSECPIQSDVQMSDSIGDPYIKDHIKNHSIINKPNDIKSNDISKEKMLSGMKDYFIQSYNEIHDTPMTAFSNTDESKLKQILNSKLKDEKEPMKTYIKTCDNFKKMYLNETWLKITDKKTGKQKNFKLSTMQIGGLLSFWDSLKPIEYWNTIVPEKNNNVKNKTYKQFFDENPNINKPPFGIALPKNTTVSV